MTAIVCVFTAYCYIVRPYRSGTANAILCLCMIGLTIQVVLIQCVVAGYSQSIFVDKYFLTITAILNGFVWLLVFLLVLFSFASKQKWPVTRETVLHMCDRQDLAVYIIKKSKAFVLEIGKIKRLGSKDRMRLTALIQDLSIQFNNFRGKQPFIMDSILETIDNLRLMQKK